MKLLIAIVNRDDAGKAVKEDLKGLRHEVISLLSYTRALPIHLCL